MKPRDVLKAAGLALALIILCTAVYATLHGLELGDVARRLGYMLIGAFAMLFTIVLWPLADDVADFGYPDTGDTHQHLEKAPIDLGYLGETEAASSAPAPSALLHVQQVGRAKRPSDWPFPVDRPEQREGESDAAYRMRLANHYGALSFPGC